jgi:hypothetical protein
MAGKQARQGLTKDNWHCCFVLLCCSAGALLQQRCSAAAQVLCFSAGALLQRSLVLCAQRKGKGKAT